MKNRFFNAAAAAVIGLTGLLGAASTASADSIEFGFGPSDGIDVQYRDYNGGYGDERDWNRGRDRYWDRGRRGRCAPWIAVDKARDRGLRRAYVADVTPRRVIVEGRRHGYRQTIVFANARGCPTIGRW